MTRSAVPANRLVVSLAWRFLRGRGNRLLDGTARAALIGTTLGVTAMVVAMALMSGYREDLRRKLVRGNAAVIAYPLFASHSLLDPEVEARLRHEPGIDAVRPVVYGQGSLVSEGRDLGVEITLRGVDAVASLDGLGDLRLQPGWQRTDRLRRDGALALVLGVELAARLEVETGDSLRLMVLGFEDGRPRFSYRQAAVAGTFSTGFSEFDQSWSVTDRRELEAMMGTEVGRGMLEVAIDDPGQADELSARIREILGADYLVTSWKDLNRELFTALEVQQVALFFVLGLIVLVSTFNIASSLVVLVREKMRDIGVLAALGLTPAQLRTVFLLYGAGLGVFGTLCGVACGSLGAWLLTEFELLRFDPEVAAIYFISSIPFKVEIVDVVAVILFTVLVTILACWVPAARAARVLPANALRYE